MYTPEAVEAVLLSQVGYEESDDGGEYRYCPAMGWDPWSAWCGIFQGWALQQAGGNYGVDCPLLHYTPTAAQGYKDRGAWSLEPQYGAHLFFDWGGGSLGSDVGLIDHIGWVLDPSSWSDGWVTTIEGNITSGGNPAVGIFQRSASVISGFGMPNYQTTPTPVPVSESEEDPMIILRNPKGWHVVMGDRLIPVGGSQDFNMVRTDVERNTVRIDVSDQQLASIKAAFTK